MKSIKKKANHVATIFSCIILAFSCTKYDYSDKRTISKSSRFSTQEIFDAMFFQAGKLAEEMPSVDHKFMALKVDELKEMESKDSEFNTEYEQYLDIKSYIFDYIAVNHPSELSLFDIKMRSGDQIEVIEAIGLISDLYIRALLASDAYSKYIIEAIRLSDNINYDEFKDKYERYGLEALIEQAEDQMREMDLNKEYNYSKESINFITVLLAGVVVVAVAAAAVAVVIGVVAGVVTELAVGGPVMNYASGREYDPDHDHHMTNPGTGTLQNEMVINDFAYLLSE